MQNINNNNATPTKYTGSKRSSFSSASFRGSLLYVQPEQRIYENTIVEDNGKASVPFYRLFRFATCFEIFMGFIGVLSAILMAIAIPLGLIAYGEFTTLLIDRIAPDGPSTPTLILQLFGGGKIIVNGTAEELRQAIIDDSAAYGIGTVVITFFQLIVGILAIDMLNYVAIKQINRIRCLMLKSILRQEIAWYDTNTNMNFASKISDDLEKIKDGIGEKIAIFVYLISTFVFSVITSFFYGWKLTLIVLSSAPVIIIATAIVAKVQSNLTTRELEAYSTAGVIAEEVLSSIRTVIAFAGEKKEVERYTKKLKPAEITGCRKGLYSGIGSGIMWLIVYLSYAIAFYYGVLFIINDRGKEVKEYTVAVLMIVFFGVLAAAQNLGLTSPHIEAFASARGSAASVFEIIDRKSQIDSLSEEGLKPDSIKGEIKFDDVHFQYPNRKNVKILQGINFTVQPGEIIALVGPSGCGKSTCIQLIQRLYDASKGCVYIDGVDIKEINVKWLRNHIGVVGQEPVLFSTTIKENIRYGNPKCSDEDVYSAAKSANCHDFIMKLPNGYNTLVGERGSQMSGGQKQRIAIARALIQNPKILLLDEATSALDLQSEAKVQKALDGASQGRTTIIVTHRLSTITNADIIIYMDKGVVMEVGTHAELMEKKTYYYNLVLENVRTDKDDAESESIDEDMSSIKLSQISLKSEQCSIESINTKNKSEENEDHNQVPLWRIMKLNMPEWYFIFLGCIASLLLGATLPVFAILFGDVYGVLSLDDAEEVLEKTFIYCIYFLVIGVVTAIGMFGQIYLFNVAGARLTSRLRIQTFDTMLKQEMGWFDDSENSVGALGIRLAGDCSAVQGITGTRIGAILQTAATLLLGVIISLFFSWKMTLVSLVIVPVIFCSVFLESRLMDGEGMKEKHAMESASKIATEAISNIRTVAGLCQEEEFLKRYIIELEKVAQSSKVKNRLRGLVFSFGQSSPYFGYGLSLYYGGLLVANNEMEYQDIIKVSECLIFGAWMIGQALAFAPNFNNAKISAQRLFKLFDRIPKITSTTNQVPDTWVAEGAINYNKIEFHYPTRPEIEVLSGLTLDIYKGKTVALVGHSGCGKSTCIQILQRLYDPIFGSVNVDNKNIVNDIPLPKLRSQLGIVSQEPVLFDKTIAENIAYGDNTRNVPMEEIIQAAKSSNIHGFITALPMGYETKLGTKGAQLSGGQKQRIAIARALIRNPKILLLDEATSALDTHSEKIVQEALDKASEGRTCIVIAHRLTTIRNADMICVLDKGQIAEYGTHEQLIKLGGLYAQLNSLQTLNIE